MFPRRGRGVVAALCAPVVAGLVVIGVGAAYATPDDPQPSGVMRDARAPEPDVAQAAPAGSGVETIELTELGHVSKEFDEPAGLSLAGSPGIHFQLTVRGVTPTQSCVGRGVDVEPVHGWFLVVDLTVSVPDAVVDLVDPGLPTFMPLGADVFTIIGPDGQVQPEALTQASWACLGDHELAAPFVGPGETVSGKVVLDSAHPSGELVYVPTGAQGWAWEFGQ